MFSLTKETILLAFALGSFSSLHAAEFTRPFESNMVLPYGKSVPVWGKGTPGEKVTVSFDKQTHTTTTDKNGVWKVTLTPLAIDAEGKKLSLTSDTSPVILNNVLVGEVWLASGQSNMEWKMKQFPDTKEDIKNADNPNFRFVQYMSALPPIAGKYTADQYDKINKETAFTGNWQIASPTSVAHFSATAYFFGNSLQKKLNIPVGIVCNAVGGSPIEAWFTAKTLNKKNYTSLKGDQWLTSPDMPAWPKSRGQDNLSELLKAGRKDLHHPFKPGYLFEYATSWMTDFPFTGIVWYQGESNAEINNIIRHKNAMLDMIQGWRKAFHQPELPFIMVQLPRINCPSALRQYWPQYREAQFQAAQKDKNTYLACTIDLGGTDSNVHPGKKKPVGERLANIALNKVYKKEEALSPHISQIIVKENRVTLNTTAKELKTTDNAEPKLFEIAGKDGNYYPAQATIHNSTERKSSITLSSPNVEKPISVRYAYKVFVEPNLVDDHNLPLFPYTSKP